MNHLSIIFRHFFPGWHVACQNMKKENFNILIIVFWIFIYPWETLFWKDDTSSLSYYLLIFPLMLAVVYSFLFPNILDKTMFLCPMGKQERIRFLNTAYYVHIIASVCFSLLDIGFLLAAGWFKISIFLLVFLLNEGMFLAVIFLHTGILSIENSSKHGFGAYPVWEFAHWIISFFAWTLSASVAFDVSREISAEKLDCIIIVVVFLMQASVFLTIMIRYRNKIMEFSSDYERSHLDQRKELQK